MNNELQEHHIMVLENTHPSGAEEWYCPTCGRRILMQWPPNYSMVTLIAGDQYAIHSGSNGGLRIKETEPTPIGEYPLNEEERATLRPWQEWFDSIDFESLWKEGNS